MKKFTFLNKILVVLFMLTLVCCETEFIPDPLDPRLPKYSETGKNVAGAIINQEIWNSVDNYSFAYVVNEPMIFLFENDSLHIVFKGNSTICDYIEFRLSGFGIYKFEDLILLKNKKIQLDGLRNSGLCLENYCNSYYSSDPDCSLSGGSGQLYIKNIVVDSVSAVISGTFGFTFTNSENKVFKVSYGRFDYRFENNLNFTLSN